MPVDPSQPTDEPWLDADGTPIRLRCWVERITGDADRGALPERLHKHGEVVGRGAGMVYVIFDRDYLIVLPPHFVRACSAREA